MKKLLSIVLLCMSVSASASLSSDWYDLEGNNKSLGNEVELQNTLDAITESQYEALDQEEQNDKMFGWKFSGLKTVLALGLSGKIGLKSWGGTRAVELNWARKSSGKIVESESEQEVINLKGSYSDDEWDTVLTDIAKSFEEEGIIEGASGFKRHLEEETATFRELIKGTNEVNHKKFKAVKLRADLVFGFSNSVSGFFIKAGGDLRVRFEWKPVPKSVVSSNQDKRVPSKVQKQMRDLLEKMGPLVVDAMDEEYKENKFLLHDKYKLKDVKFGLSLSVEGDLGFTKGSQGIGVFVYLAPIAHKEATGNISGDLPFTIDVEDKIWPFKKKKIVKLSKRKIKKGIKKAIRFGHYFGKKINDKKDSKWAVQVMKTSYTFSLKGKTGVVTIKGAPTIEMAYKNTQFKKASKEKTFGKKNWGLNAVRVRTRLKGGVEIPWLAKFELKPFVETYYKQ